MMKILLVNDDGIESKELQALAARLSENHELFVVAPLREQSGMSQALTLNHNLTVYRRALNLGEKQAYAVDGTPGDCVKIGLESLLAEENIDLVISGINNGYNLGTDIIYSGTVGAATEGYIHGINSAAFSISSHSEIEKNRLMDLTVDIIDRLFENPTEKNMLYNVNFPPVLGEEAVFTMTEQGIRRYEHEYHIHEMQPGVIEYGIKGKAIDTANKFNSDIATVERGEISITPLVINRTNYKFLADFGGVE